MIEIEAYSASDIGNPRKDLDQDFAADARIVTAGGLTLQIGVVCDGVSNGEHGVAASSLTARIILETIQSSSDTDIPSLLSHAVRTANYRVLRDVPEGNATVALFAIHVKAEDPFGRLYVASVGDSPILILREGRVLRANTDHNYANDLLLDGKILPDEVDSVPRGEALTRAIGIDDQLNVDIGFYIGGVGRDVAHQRGVVGYKLKEGDTVLACSDGLTDGIKQIGRAYVTEEDFLRHALDDDVVRSGKSLLGYAIKSGTHDNVSISLAFIPSPKRRALGAVDQRTSRGVLVALLTGLIAIGLIAVLVVGQVTGTANVQQTESAQTIVYQARFVAEQQSTAEQIQTEAAYTDTPLPTATASPTPTATRTSTPRPTIDPANAEDLVGFIFTTRGNSRPVLDREPIRDAEDTYISLDGGEEIEEPANLFMQADTELEVDRVNNRSLSATLLLFPGGNVFARTGQYAAGGMTMQLASDRNVLFTSQGTCMSAAYVEESQVAFTCYADGDNCLFSDETELEGGQVLVWDLSSGEQESIRDILYEDAVAHNALVAQFTDLAVVPCLQPYVDTDADDVLNELDQCPEERGTSAFPRVRGCLDDDGDGIANVRDRCPTVPGVAPTGCPADNDGDGVPDNRDRCPNQFGSLSNGCPDDTDNDGIDSARDQCPTQFGPASNNGCPLPVNRSR